MVGESVEKGQDWTFSLWEKDEIFKSLWLLHKKLSRKQYIDWLNWEDLKTS